MSTPIDIVNHPASYSTTLAELRANFNQGLTKNVDYRRKQLLGLARFLKECERDIEQALYEDLHKPPIESYLAETSLLAMELRVCLKKLNSWVKAKKVPTPLSMQPGKSFIHPEPLGVVLIISPWNYPIQLVLAPLIGAIAAGNCAIIKPSEMAASTAKLLEEKLPLYLDSASIRIINGGVEETTALLKEQFDYIFYTGNTTVGRIVMEAASKHLTPLTLELGGKSPCIVNKDTNLVIAARRIVWGKFMNAGQTCVAPDYLLVHEDIAEELLKQIQKTLIEFWGQDPQKSPDYGRIINTNHFHRLMRLLPGSGTIVAGGQSDEQSQYIAPTVLSQVPDDAPIMQDEIFGPILPLLKVKNMEDAIRYINKKPKPLSLYCFTNDKQVQKQVLEQTSSGTVCINHTIVQLAVTDLPFGGVGLAGMGAYHGEASFKTFSHYKSVLKKPCWPDITLMYPPYKNLLRFIAKLFM